MIAHLFKLVWNRKQTNALIAAEVFFSFLVLFATVTLGVYFADNYRQPLGFSYRNVWSISSLDRELILGDGAAEKRRQILLALQEMEEIESVAGVDPGASPYGLSRSNAKVKYQGRKVRTQLGGVTDGFKETVGLRIVQGRWFERADDAVDWTPVVINRKLSRELFGQEDPLGQDIGKRRRVVGVISDFRRTGEFSGIQNFMLIRAAQPRWFLIRVRPGITADFEEELMGRLTAIARGGTLQIETLDQARTRAFKFNLAPLIVAGTVATFLVLMVGLGLMGVLWQNVTQRTREIGLRRAHGATAKRIHRQVLGELLAVTTIGLGAGIVCVVQFPLLDIVSFLSGEVYFSGLAVSLGIMYLLTILCGWYPSWLATKVHPAEALHHE